MFNFLRDRQSIFHSDCNILHFLLWFTKLLISLHPHKHLVFSGFGVCGFFNNSHPNEYKVVSYCGYNLHFFNGTRVEYLFIGLLASPSLLFFFLSYSFFSSSFPFPSLFSPFYFHLSTLILLYSFLSPLSLLPHFLSPSFPLFLSSLQDIICGLTLSKALFLLHPIKTLASPELHVQWVVISIHTISV